MEEYLEKLKQKFHYGEELMNLLSHLIPAMITYYGKEYENMILEALLHCEIHFQEQNEKPKEYLNDYFGVNKDWKIPFLGGAFYQNEIFVKENQVMAKPILYLIRVYLHQYIPFDFQKEEHVNTLIHEICHLIKGYGKLKVVDGKIIDSTGLMKTVYTYTPEKGVQEEMDDHVGIEEAINEVDTIRIMEIMTGKKQEIYGYQRAGILAEYLLDYEDIAKVIKFSQFHDNENWIQYLGEENAKMLIENFDILVKSMYLSFSDINSEEKIKALHDKMDSAERKIYEFTQNYSKKEDIESSPKAL